jgi:integrase
LSESQLGTLFTELPRRGKSNPPAIKILLATASRKMELARARWEHIELEAATWATPMSTARPERPLSSRWRLWW